MGAAVGANDPQLKESIVVLYYMESKDVCTGEESTIHSPPHAPYPSPLPSHRPHSTAHLPYKSSKGSTCLDHQPQPHSHYLLPSPL